jgi:hypothetical protein
LESIPLDCVAPSFRLRKAADAAFGETPSTFINKIWLGVDARELPHSDCTSRSSRPAVFVERHEYANMYHQYTDWFNALVSMRLLRTDDVDVHLFDAHPPSPIDDMWRVAFNSSLQQTVLAAVGNRSIVCYDRVFFAPLGYHSRSFKRCADADEVSEGSLLRDLRQRAMRAYGLDNITTTTTSITTDVNSTTTTELKCVVIARRDYVAHLRNPSGRVVRKWSDESMIIRATHEVTTTGGRRLD